MTEPKPSSRRTTRAAAATRAKARPRPPVERLVAIHEAMAKGGKPNAMTFARKLEVSPKTIRRDLAFMRDQLNLPIEYDIIEQGFYYSKPVENLPTLKITEGDLFALLAAQQAIQLYKNTPYTRTLKASFKKLVSTLTGQITFRSSAIPPISLRRTAAAAPEAPETIALFHLAAKAILEHIEVTFDYQAPGTPRPARCHAQPIHLINAQDYWYLIAYDKASYALRIFALSHMSNFVLTKHYFQRRKRFSTQDQLM